MAVTLTRRDFLGVTGGTLLSAAVPHRHPMPAPADGSALDLSTLARFVDPLPIPPIARPLSQPRAGAAAAATYRLPMRVVMSRIHRDLPPTRFWSFGSTFPGPTIDTRRGRPSG